MSGKLLVLALAAIVWLAPAAVAGAHTGHEHAGASPPAVATAAAGEAHAEAHTAARELDNRTRARWARLTPAQREQRIARTARQTRALNAALVAGRARDDVGYWDQTLYPLPEYAINAIVLPTSKVLIFGREPYVGATRSNLGSARLFDPLTGATSHVPPPPIPENLDADGNELPAPIFCAGQTLLSDGRVLLAGGNLSDPTSARPNFSGLDYTFIFDPWSQTWELGPRMTQGRWYPTLTKLSSGDVLIAGGLDENGQGIRNGRLDIWRPGDTAATPLEPFRAGSRADPRETGETLPPDASFGLSPYPFMFLLPDGNVALAGPGRQDSAILDTTVARDRGAAPGSAWTQIRGSELSQVHQGGTTAIEPDVGSFAGSWNLLAMAGADDARPGLRLARTTVDRLDARPGALGWTHDPQDDLNQARFYPNGVLLPDGGVVVVGGGLGASDDASDDARGNYYLGDAPPPELKQVELRRPGERSWRLGAAQQEYRTYHSTAWLMPDGRIVSAGDDGNQKLVASRDDAEIYWPPYLFDGDDCALRPAIRGVGAPGPPAAQGARAWATLTYGEAVGIFSEHAQEGMRAVLAAPAATTHGVDMSQRLVALRVDATVEVGGLNVTMPATASIAPPGYYLLFVVDRDGTPSKARWVHLLPAGDAAAARGGATPATVTGASPDAQGRSCVNPDGSERSEPAPASTAARTQPSGTRTQRVRLPAKLGIARASILRARRELDVLAPISALARGRVALELAAAGRRTRMTAPIDTRRRRIRVRRRIPAAQAALGTGILTLTYKGSDATRAQTVRLRAAARHAELATRRPTLSAGGRLRASGTVSSRARGVVRVQLELEHEGRTRTFEVAAPIRRGRWKLDERLPRDVRDAIARRTGTVQSYTLFTGYLPARMRGEMRTYQLLAAR